MLLKKSFLVLVLVGAASALPGTVGALPIAFGQFVQQSAIDAALCPCSDSRVIGFAYGGNKFVGTVYPQNGQLYQTNLTGGAVAKFGSPIAGADLQELYVSSSLGLGGFPLHDFYVSAGVSNRGLYYFNNAGSVQGAFTVTGATGLNSEYVKGIAFDPYGNYGYNMLVSTDAGNLYKVTSAGVATTLASIPGAVLEGIDFAPTGFGTFGGQAVVVSENVQTLYAISTGGVVTNLSLFGASVPLAEEIGFVPLNLGSGGSLEGFYAASYPYSGIQKADASQFAGMLGDAIVTSEDGSSARVWDVHWDGSSFVVTQIGNLSGQAEDGIFVTEAIVTAGTPEPATLTLLGLGLAGLGIRKRRKT